jgi:hypothetical protein
MYYSQSLHCALCTVHCALCTLVGSTTPTFAVRTPEYDDDSHHQATPRHTSEVVQFCVVISFIAWILVCTSCKDVAHATSNSQNAVASTELSENTRVLVLLQQHASAQSPLRFSGWTLHPKRQHDSGNWRNRWCGSVDCASNPWHAAQHLQTPSGIGLALATKLLELGNIVGFFCCNTNVGLYPI